jgi:hypothetical protein
MAAAAVWVERWFPTGAASGISTGEDASSVAG